MNDILHDVLSRLPAKCVLRFRTVCKTWKLIIEDSSFVKSHTKNQHSHASSTMLIRNSLGGGLRVLHLDRLIFADGIQEIDGITSLKQIIHRGVPRLDRLPVAVCNGLILICRYDYNTQACVIWNPLVEDFHVAPPPPRSLTGSTGLRGEYRMRSSGIGYDESTDDYKVVIIGYRRVKNEFYPYKTLVYTLKSRCWRAIKEFPSEACVGSRGVYLKGALHWRSRDAIIAFDVGKETHICLPLPPTHPRVESCSEKLDALDGCLIFSCIHYGKKVEGWVMDECGSSWTKLFSVPTRCILRVVAFLKSQAQVFFEQLNGSLVWLHLQTNSAKCVLINGLSNDHLSFAQFNPGSILRLDNTKSGSTAPLKRFHARSRLVFSLQRATIY